MSNTPKLPWTSKRPAVDEPITILGPADAPPPFDVRAYQELSRRVRERLTHPVTVMQMVDGIAQVEISVTVNRFLRIPKPRRRIERWRESFERIR